MPDNNYNYGASYIMGSDKTSVDDPMGSNKLTRESKESKPTVEASLFKMADDKNYF